jgi:hypothetical protein
LQSGVAVKVVWLFAAPGFLAPADIPGFRVPRAIRAA